MTENKDIRLELAKPFSTSDVEWRISNTTKDKARGLAVPYIDSRAIQNRLDTVLGAYNWQTQYLQWHQNGQKASQLCVLSVYDSERKEWIAKCDGAENTDIEPIKGGEMRIIFGARPKMTRRRSDGAAHLMGRGQRHPPHVPHPTVALCMKQ